jgi:hypothetical protein
MSHFKFASGCTIVLASVLILPSATIPASIHREMGCRVAARMICHSDAADGCRSRTLYLGNADPRLRRHCLYDLSSEVKAGIDGRLIYNQRVEFEEPPSLEENRYG